MKMTKILLAVAGFALSATTVAAQSTAYFTNPVIRGDIADPSVMRYGDMYYAMGTSSEWAPFYPVFESHDLVNWKQTGHVFEQQPEWTTSSFWAPEWYCHNGKVYVYYTARNKAGTSYIGVATADSPTGVFTDHGPVVEYGTEAIDAFILEDNGDLYISWKAYGLDKRPIELLAARLTADGLKMSGEPFSLLRDDERQGMEGQHWFKHGGYYYLLYAIRGCCGTDSDYAVSVARSKELKGPYEKYAGNPILHGSDEVKSIGHGTLTQTPDGRMYYLCHAYSEGADFYMGRQPHLQEMRIGEDGWPYFVTGEYARLVQPMPLLAGVQEPVADFYDDFTGNELRVEWTWNYPWADVKAVTENGRLTLGGDAKPGYNGGTALCVRPTDTDYELTTAVVNRNDDWKGVTMYGDGDNYLAFGCVGDRLKLKTVRDGKENVLVDEPVRVEALHVRMTVEEGIPAGFAWSCDGKVWMPVADGMTDGMKRGLVRWDRVARPGLYHEGNGEAVFEYASVKNR